jgi:hypothetical protein
MRCWDKREHIQKPATQQLLDRQPLTRGVGHLREEGVSHIGVHLKDYSGRDFGGDFVLVRVDEGVEQISFILQYAGTKATKRLTTASLQLPKDVLRCIADAIGSKTHKP